MQRRTLLLALLAAFTTALAPLTVAAENLKVGARAGAHAQILEVVKKVAERDGLNIQIVEFSDYIQPNAALASGDIDANSYQHQPYLDNTTQDRGYKLVSVAKTIIAPIGLYSKKIKALSELPLGGRVAIPNDPSNGGRSLLLLEAHGVIKLKANAGLKATPLDIAENPKKIKFIELDAAQLPRSLDEVDAATVNTNYAIPAGLLPTRDAIIIENPNSPYANVIAVRPADRSNPAVLKLVKAYHTDEVKAFVVKEFKGSLVPTW